MTKELEDSYLDAVFKEISLRDIDKSMELDKNHLPEEVWKRTLKMKTLKKRLLSFKK